MSKTTKIIAALGVVAGLGVAALPAFTFAEGEPSVSGNVDVYVKVLPAIAMTITGNNDDNSIAGAANANDPVQVKDPSGVTTIGTTDVSSYDNTTAQTISSSAAALLPNSLVHGTADSTGFKSTVTVYTNNASGYTLGIAGTGSGGALSALVKQYDGTAPQNPATIPAGTTVEAGTPAWGYNTTAQTGDTGTYIATANSALKTTNTPTAGGDATNVFYGVSTAADQETGVYKASLTYTATCNQ